jgi:hypothetical protein
MTRWLVRLLSQEARKWSRTLIYSGIYTRTMKSSILLLTILTGYENPVLTLLIFDLAVACLAVAYVTPHYRCRSNHTINTAFRTYSGSAPFYLTITTYLTIAPLPTYLPYHHTYVVTMATRQYKIEPLTEDNYDTWITDARASLRKLKLWDVCQKALPPYATVAQKEKHTDAADELILIISANIKARLTDAEQNDSYLLLTKLKEINSPATEQVFYTSCQELLTLHAAGTDLETFLVRIKTLNEKIDRTGIELDAKRRTLLVLILGLGSSFETLVQIWSITPDLTADMAIRQLRAEHHRLAHQEPRDDASFLAIRKRRGAFPTAGEPLAKRVATRANTTNMNTCSTCGKDHPGICWGRPYLRLL